MRAAILKEIKLLSHLNVDTDTKYNELKEYLTTGLVPAHFDRFKKSRYKKRYRNFAFENDEIVYHSDLPKLRHVAEDNKVLIEEELPRKLVLPLPSNKLELIYDLYLVPQNSAYRSAQSFYEKLAEEFVGISLREVDSVLKTIQSKQLVNKKKTDVIVKPIVKNKIMQQWEMDLVDVSQFAQHNN